MLQIFLLKNRKFIFLDVMIVTNITKFFIQYKFVSNKLIFFLKFYLMRETSDIQLQIINIQIGCTLRLARLKKKISQQTIALKLDYNSTMIGRIERFEGISGWDKIYSISTYLNVDFSNLFVLKSKETLISIINESYNLEEKLTQEKKDYYNFLRKTIDLKFELLEKIK